jgi:hypothetical protein
VCACVRVCSEVVRGKEERAQLPGYLCPLCKGFCAALVPGSYAGDVQCSHCQRGTMGEQQPCSIVLFAHRLSRAEHVLHCALQLAAVVVVMHVWQVVHTQCHKG